MKNYGYQAPVIDVQKDWILGTSLSAPKIVLQPDGQWDDYLVKKEAQDANGFDPLSCATYGTQNAGIEILGRRVFGVEQNYSDRWVAYHTDTHKKGGNDPHVIAEWIRKRGTVKEESWPLTPDIDSFEKYYEEPPQKLFTEASLFPAEYVFGHEYVPSNPAAMKEALKYSPLGASVYAWPKRDPDGYYYKLPEDRDNHWICLYGYEDGKYWKVFDSADKSEKKLRWDALPSIIKRYSITKQIISDKPAWQRFVDNIFNIINSWLPKPPSTLPQKPVVEKPELPPPPIPPPSDDKLITALIQVESNGNDYAIGDKHLKDKAYGCLQIRRPVCLDVNRVYKTNHSPMAMLGNRELSIKVARMYWNIYKCKTDEEKARSWNGGPTAKTPGTKMYKATNAYWSKVKALLK